MYYSRDAKQEADMRRHQPDPVNHAKENNSEGNFENKNTLFCTTSPRLQTPEHQETKKKKKIT